MATNISFDGNSLQTASILTDTIGHEQIANKLASLFQLAHANKSTIPFVSYPSKSIKVSGKVIGSNIADLDSKLDTFRSYFLGTEKNLDIDYNGTTRRYIATVNGLTIDRPGGLAYANFAIDFICSQPFGQATAVTNAINASGRTLSAYSDAHTFIGTAPYQLPIFTLTYVNPVSGSTNLVTNPGFEVDTTGWSTGGVGTISRVTAQFHSGVAALQTVNAATAVGGNYGWPLYFVGGLTVGQSYTLVAWMKGNAGGESITYGVPGKQSTIALTTSWQQVIISFTATSTTMELDFISTAPANGTWFLDDVSVIANSSASVSIGNASNGQGVYITRTWAAGDVLLVDCLNKAVKVNGADVAFSGAFPEFPPGAQNISYNDTFVSRTFNVLAPYNPLYM